MLGATINASMKVAGYVTVYADWIPDPNVVNDLPPLRLPVNESISASCTSVTNNQPTGFEEIQVEIDCGGSGTFIFPPVNTNVGKSTYLNNFTAADNPNHLSRVYLPTRHLKATLSGRISSQFPTPWGGLSVSYQGSVWLRPIDSEVQPVLLKERTPNQFYSIDAKQYGPLKAGDRLWAGMEFRVGPNTRLASKHKSMTLRIKEGEYPASGNHQHSTNNNFVDVDLPLVAQEGVPQRPMKWQKRTEYSNW
jgi:hypothetical protein